MNTLVINGSPKSENSNTMNLTRAFLEGAGWANAEIVNVAKSGVKSCLGCYACWNKTPGKCVINDDMNEILSKIIDADVIIWSFPLYYFSVPGNLKNLIDRQLPLNLPFMKTDSENGGHPARYDLSRQRHIIVSTCDFWTATGNYAAILCGQGELFRIPELKNRTDAYLEIVRRAGAEFACGDICAETKAELSKPLFPRDVFEKMANASWGISETRREETDDSFHFTKQMAALYKPDGRTRVLEFCYTDINKTYQILLMPQGSEVLTENFKPSTTKIKTPYSIWRTIARGDISGQDALFQRQYKVSGDFEIMLRWDELFGGSVPNRPAEGERRCKTNMTVLLAPWVIIWIVLQPHQLLSHFTITRRIPWHQQVKIIKITANIPVRHVFENIRQIFIRVQPVFLSGFDNAEQYRTFATDIL